MFRMAPKTVGSVRFLNIHEWQSKQLIQKYIIFCVFDILGTEVELNPVKSLSLLKELRILLILSGTNVSLSFCKSHFLVPGCKFVVKAQVLAGGRGKGHWENGMQGGVKLAKT